MIINDPHRFVFVHIPKCAGTSVRVALEKLDTSNGAYSKTDGQHPGIGRIDLAHVPLSVLREHFPEDYRKVRDYHSVAVVRDPYRRFSSSLYQRLSMYGAKPVRELSVDEFRRGLDEAMEFLARNKDRAALPYDYIHFQRQDSYVHDAGTRLIDALYTTSQLPQLMSDVQARTGVALGDAAGDTHAGKAVFYKSGLARNLARAVLPIYKRGLSQVMPSSLKEGIKGLFYDDKDDRTKDMFSAHGVREFVGDYYADDIRLFESVAKPAMKAAA